MAQDDFWQYVDPKDLPGDLQMIAEELGVEAVAFLTKYFGGTQIYITSPNTIKERTLKAVIIEEYDGTNEAALIDKYDVTRRFVHEAIGVYGDRN